MGKKGIFRPINKKATSLLLKSFSPLKVESGYNEKAFNDYVGYVKSIITDKKFQNDILDILVYFGSGKYVIDGYNFYSKVDLKYDTRYINVYSDGYSFTLSYVCGYGKCIRNITQYYDENNNKVLMSETRNIGGSSVNDREDNKKLVGDYYDIETITRFYDEFGKLTCEEVQKTSDKFAYKNRVPKFDKTFSCFDNVASDRREYYLDDIRLISDVRIDFVDGEDRIVEYYGIYYGTDLSRVIYTEIDKELFDQILTHDISIEEAKNITKNEVIKTRSRNIVEEY